MEPFRRKDAAESELLRSLRKKDILKAEFQISIIKVTGIPTSVPQGSDLYIEWDRKKKGVVNTTKRVQHLEADAVWGENASIEATLLVEAPDKFAKKKLTLSLFEEAAVGGKKKSLRIGKVIINLELCAKAEPSPFTLPLSMEPKYQRGAEPAQLKFNVSLKRLMKLNNYLLVPADTSPQTRRGSGPPVTPRVGKTSQPEGKNAEEGKTIYFAGRMYRMQAADEKDEASDEEDSDDDEGVARLRKQLASIEKQLAEKTALAANQENHILSLQRQLAGARNVTDHEPRYAMEQMLSENTLLREKLAQPAPEVPVDELRRTVAVLTDRTRTLEADALITDDARREVLRLRAALVALQQQKSQSNAPFKWLALLMIVYLLLLLVLKR